MEEYVGVSLSLILSGVMGYRYYLTSKFMPAGLVGMFSILMTVFFIYRILNPLPLKTSKKKT